ncbi:xanthine dehydrogenase family protein molybdopterin-binding subunit [Streptomyces sp. DH37]|uniref:xanthine dehydrogenase family protein molybdopterin-binding subunit n=1 Tax=Streptomyces sp. DH37 TaxID=3040122 RepID=UPI002441FC9D|nr:xanthine dehydrogenase family protein molybdopterin-binding subunit [Streptomyces sp. DH37]MDG9701998.1 xanthine dehydrogenase family protein molybdopterin-binding subunit [Streptomyces sp. DH37]
MSAPVPPSAQRAGAYDKVTGRARYTADHRPPGLLHAALAVATIGRGRVTGVDTAAACAVPGVRLVLTRLDEHEVRPPGFPTADSGYGFQSLQPLLDDRVAYRGQPVALVVADTPVAAAEAADLVEASYEAEPVAVTLGAEGTETVSQAQALSDPRFSDVSLGDADAVLASCPVRIDAAFDLAPQHQVPLEPPATVVRWRGDTLTVYESTQNSGAVRHGLARQLGIDHSRIEVVSPDVGGGFGQKAWLQSHLAPMAVAARRLGRPVGFVMSRRQTFHGTSFRPASRHRVRLGADRSGKLAAVIHESWQQTSRHDLFPSDFTTVTSRLYGVTAFRGAQWLERTDVQTPGFMRAPFEHVAAFVLESAMDELAYATGRDPVALRLANDTATDPVTGLPFSSRHLAECLRRGAARFGWAARTPRPGSMRDADGTLVGWGVAAGAYRASAAPAAARLRVDARGRVALDVTGHEMGQGLRTAVARTVAEDLGVAPGDVRVVLGDTRGVAQHLTAGSWGTATALAAVHAVLRKLRARLGLPGRGRADLAAALAAARLPAITVEATTRAPGQSAEAVERMLAGRSAPAGPVYPGFSAFSFAAHFAEVRVEAATGRVCVPRVVSVVDCGRVVSPATAASQVRGGVVWGIGAALREGGEPDPRFGGFVNADLAEYLVPVNADVGRIDVDFIGEPDPRLVPAGAKGLGEVALVGVAPAIANAIHHATGRRHRRLPIRREDLL